MRFYTVFILGIILVAQGVFAEDKKFELKNDKDRISYSIGVNIGANMKKQSLDINPVALAKGINDAIEGKEILLSEQEMNDILATLQKELMAKQMERQKELAEKNKKEGDAFLEENKKKEGVITLASGLQYKVITEGTGESPSLSDTVTVNYSGKLIDGTEFDSSYKRGQPAVFRVNSVIPGFSEALQLMKPGGKWQIFIPGNLGYGERGAGKIIEPNATLIFEVELISFEKGMKYHTDQMMQQMMNP